MLYTLLLAILLAMFMMYRNHWVYKYRTKLLNHMLYVVSDTEDLPLEQVLTEAVQLNAEYHALPSYSYMVLQVWKWKY